MSLPDQVEPIPLVIAPRQERSRRTLDRLLDAAEGVLSEAGVEGTTVPRIAERAAMSVGVIYRRFRDKDALLRAVYERFFERSAETNRRALDPARWSGASVREILEVVVGGMVRGHAQHRRLLRALLLYADTHQDPDFRRRAEALNTAAVGQVASLLRTRAAELAHPDPERGVALALVVVASALGRWLHPGADRVFGYADADALAAELTRMVTAYLGVR